MEKRLHVRIVDVIKKGSFKTTIQSCFKCGNILLCSIKSSVQFKYNKKDVILWSVCFFLFYHSVYFSLKEYRIFDNEFAVILSNLIAVMI